jgi:hypothetical protein
MAAAMNTRPSWPSIPPEGYYQGDEHAQPAQALPDQGPAQAAIGEMAALLRDTRSNMLVGGIVLSATAIAIALEVAFVARAFRPGVAGMFSGFVLCCLLVCWLTALVQLAMVGRPVLHTLSEIRWGTGSPVDPRARWLTVPPVGAHPEAWTWTRAHLMIGAARLARWRSQRADTWTYITAAAFLVWTVVILLGL